MLQRRENWSLLILRISWEFIHLASSRAATLTRACLASPSSQCFITSHSQPGPLPYPATGLPGFGTQKWVSLPELHFPPAQRLSSIPYSPLTSAEFSDPNLQIPKLNSLNKRERERVQISSEKPEWFFSLFVCLESCNLPKKTIQILERSWFLVLKKMTW